MTNGIQPCALCQSVSTQCECISSTETQRFVPTHVSPLAIQFEAHWTNEYYESVVSALSFDDEPNAVARFQERLRQASEFDHLFRFVPDTPFIEVHVVQPLRQAKASFALAHYDACIALAGMVAEKLATLLFELTDKQGNYPRLTDDQRRTIAQNAVDRLDHYKRIELLHGLGVLNDKDARGFHRIRKIRNAHVHMRTANQRTPKQDALECYRLLAILLDRFLNLKQTAEGKGPLMFPPLLHAYLQRRSGKGALQ